MIELSLNGVKKYKDTNLVLKNISFQVYDNEKVGIVGENGSGKSTILKLIAGIEELNCYPGSTSIGYDQGFISLNKGATTAYLDQLPIYDEGVTVIEVLRMAFEEAQACDVQMRILEQKMQNTQGNELETILKQYSELQQSFELKSGYEMEEKIRRICTGLDFDEDFLNKEFSVLSGGEKTTTILGKILIENPDVLLLDEPTNHLDLKSIEWLEGYLKGYKGIVIIVSHDRYFLDNVVEKIIEIEDKLCETYNGNYSAFLKQKEENMLKQFDDFREQQKQIGNMENTVKNLRDWALRADNNKFFKRAVSIQKKLDKMDRIKKPTFEKQNMKLNFNKTERSGNETIKVEGLLKCYDNRVLFNHADMLVKYGERVALIGANGSGKTTLLKLLLEQEQMEKGVARIGANVRMAYLPQQIEFGNEQLTVLDCFREDVSILDGKAREYLSRFMFFGSTVYKKVCHLSGGERIRLKLAKLLFEDVNLLILDEPTNHLDIESIETLEEALDEFRGTIFFISHDRYFINKISKRIIAIEESKLISYDGDFDSYRNISEQKYIAKELQSQSAPPIVKVEKAKNKKVVSLGSQVDTTKVEQQIETLEIEIKQLELEMNTPEIGYQELAVLHTQKEWLSSQLHAAMELWVNYNS